MQPASQQPTPSPHSITITTLRLSEGPDGTPHESNELNDTKEISLACTQDPNQVNKSESEHLAGPRAR